VFFHHVAHDFDATRHFIAVQVHPGNWFGNIVAGVVVFIILVAVSQSAGTKASAAPRFLPVVMAVLLITQAGAIWVARKRSAS
jgi:hypothetical protein